MRSILHPGDDPRELARAYRNILGVTTVYLADLDAIIGRDSRPSLHREIADLGLDAWIDAGIRDAADVAGPMSIDRASVVIGLESLHGPAALREVLDRYGPERLIVSLDLRAGRPVQASPGCWNENEATAIALRILSMGVRRMILLDLARVGSGHGAGTEILLGSLLRVHPEAEIAVGGGIADEAEVRAWRDRGASAVLVGSALHDGRIGRDEVTRLMAPSGG